MVKQEKDYKEKKREVRHKIIESKRKAWDNKYREIDTCIGGRKCSESWKFINKVTKRHTAHYN